ncbi:efflux transporter outer membrane subunit [Psychroflexus aestuariivivens]|uniref:efflux transporter outer membrane subunit n=1 Tax=Psychroflexus aestuariivivens TaxID=1795040 RepID=UPI001F012FDA|nr:efflux transporter outer membrane subunit [Psychroflexus aestuariivivens]
MVTLLFILSCGPKLDQAEPPIPQPQAFSYSGTEAIPDRWWTAFENEQLNQIIDTALTKNLSLESIWQQFQAAKSNVRIQGSNLWPQIESSLQSGISRPVPDFAGGENTQAGLSASYEIDLWGRLSSAKEAEAFRAQASFYDYQAGAMSLSAEISIAYFRVITTKRQIELVKEQIEINNKILKLIRARFGSGQVRAVDILRQEQLLESTRNLQITFERDLKLAKNQLSLLIGKPAQNELEINKLDLPELGALPKSGLPLELARRRPDIKNAHARVLAADRDYAVAIRNKYPRLSIRTSVQARSNTYSNLFDEWAYNIAGNLVAPLLYGGRLRAEADRSEAFKNSAMSDYGQTVLQAFKDVEDALVNEKKQKERLEVLKRQLNLTDKTNSQIRLEFLNGLSNYLDVLLALDEQQQLKRDKIEAEQRLLEFRIGLYRSLAGGFETERETKEKS